MRTALPLIAAMTLVFGTTAPRAEEKPFACPAVPAPVVALNFGSRYTDDSKTRSDIDEVSNAEVDRALQPVEKFIGELMKMATTALMDGDTARGGCVLDWLDQWAAAGALTGLETLNVKLAIPARYAGLAIALLQAETAGPLDPAKRARVVAWLTDVATAMEQFFDNDAPKNAKRANLRAWAGLAAAAIGRLNGDSAMLDWAKGSFELVTCQASPDGSLPLEMNRADKALNYQLHATAPLIVTADLLKATGYDGYAACDGKLSPSPVQPPSHRGPLDRPEDQRQGADVPDRQTGARAIHARLGGAAAAPRPRSSNRRVRRPAAPAGARQARRQPHPAG